jgi:hypothetical protein
MVGSCEDKTKGRWLSSGILRRVISKKLIDVSEFRDYTAQKTVIFLLATVRTSNLTQKAKSSGFIKFGEFLD